MELLEQHFETAFDAPDGIDKLRELIVTLALQGKLVEQDSDDLPASELLKGMTEEKQILIDKGQIKKNKPLPVIKSEDIPYLLPSSWTWVRLGDVSIESSAGQSPQCLRRPKMEHEWGVLKISAVSWGEFNPNENKALPPEKEFKQENEVKVGDFLLSRANTEELVARSVIVKTTVPKLLINDKIIRFTLSKGVSKEFVNIANLSNGSRKYYAANASGTSSSMKNVTRDVMCRLPIPLPPLPEQCRIVAKIDQLMARCDELEKLRTERDRKRLTVHTAALNRLLTAQTSDTSTDAWRFIAQHFGELYAVKENVAELRKAILQLAVMGKLVEQDPSDEPASELLKAIQTEKQKLLKEGKIKRPKSFSAITPKEIPYQLPTGWEWIRLGNSGAFERGKSKHRPRNDKRLFQDGIYPFVQTGDVSKAKTTDDVITTCGKYYNDFGLKQSRLWPKDTLCITIAANIAETGFLGMEACIPDSVVAFLSLNDSISKFVKFFIDVAKEDLENYAPSTAQKNINLGIINDLLFPFPPLAEQHRIVAKVDQLMALCDTLEQQIDNATHKQTALLNAVMAQV